ncbi:cuticle protein 21-like [Artemia franciscana]|uniref:Cuticle protein n=1 Tax=Artemia franciscana TaxID=6661 RepID=A0AA88I453_ARTSF|nr:hypothetical protein QYM36_009894 [Artemia franciscana]
MKVLTCLTIAFAFALADEAYKTSNYKEPLMPYNFGWVVKDDPTYNDFSQQESSDGNQVVGSYRVLLPDGRLQIVSYTVDEHSGFNADIKYEGEAQYPAYTPKYDKVSYEKPKYNKPTYSEPSYQKPSYKQSSEPAYEKPVNTEQYSYTTPAYNQISNQQYDKQSYTTPYNSKSAY